MMISFGEGRHNATRKLQAKARLVKARYSPPFLLLVRVAGGPYGVVSCVGM